MSEIFEKFVIKSNKPAIKSPKLSVPAYIWDKLIKLNKDSTLIIDANTDRKLCVEEFMRKSQSIAMSLIDTGVNKTDIIMTFAENSIELVIALMASLLLGTTIYPISPISNIYEMQTLLQTLGSITIFATKAKTKLIEEVLNRSVINGKQTIDVKNIIVFDGVLDNYLYYEELLSKGKDKNLIKIPYFDVEPKTDTFILLQSSGTSGVPKSVMISHNSYVQSIQTFVFSKNFDNPIMSHITPFGCISGSSILLSGICLGIPTVIYRQYSEELIVKSIDKYKVNKLFTTPTLVHKLIDKQFVGKYDLTSLRFINTGGAAIPGHLARKLIEKYGVKFQEGYGMTETGVLTNFFDAEPDDPEYIPGSLGRPAPCVLLKVVDINTGENLGPNIDGEICAKGETLFSGYLNNSSAYEEAFDRKGWFHTGDVGHYDNENRFYITDRLKEIIKFGTKQVSPTELEQLLLTHSSVAEVAVVGVRHKIDTQWPRAYVKTKPDVSVSEEELRKYVSDNVSVAKQLRAGVVFVDTIPRTTIGKVDRRYFKQLVANEVIG